MTPDVDHFLRTHAPIATEGSLATGMRVQQWEIVAFLARGAYGEVYRGRHLKLHCPLALKYALGNKVPRLTLEAELLAALRHPMFPTVYGLEPVDEGALLAEELLEPYPLPHNDRAVAKLLRDLCVALTYLHGRGWAHRDLKPANLMRRPGETTPVIVDLGIAKRLSAYTESVPSELSLLSDGKALHFGTPGYAAPEQITGNAITTATDIHALGILINRCFDGKLPRAWRTIVRRATSALPDLRYPNAKALARAIRRRHLPRLIGLILLALLAALLLLLGTFTASPEPTSPPPQENASIRILRSTPEAKDPMQINHEYFQALHNLKPGEKPPPLPERSPLLMPETPPIKR